MFGNGSAFHIDANYFWAQAFFKMKKILHCSNDFFYHVNKCDELLKLNVEINFWKVDSCPYYFFWWSVFLNSCLLNYQEGFDILWRNWIFEWQKASFDLLKFQVDVLLLFFKDKPIDLSIKSSFGHIAKTPFWEIVIIENLVLNLINKILFRVNIWCLPIQKIDKSNIHKDTYWLLSSLNLLNDISSEDVSWLEWIYLHLLLLFLIIDYFLTWKGCFRNKLLVQKYGEYYVQDIFPDLEISHHCHLFHLYFKNFFVGIERDWKTLSLPSFMWRHKCISFQRLGVDRRIGSIADSEQLFHADVFLIGQFKFKKLGLTSEVVLIDMFVIEGTWVNIEKLVAGDILVVDVGVIGYFDIMDGHKFHFDFMFVVLSWEGVVQIPHLSSKVTAAQGQICMFDVVINTPASLIGNWWHIFEKIELNCSKVETQLELLFEVYVFVALLLGNFISWVFEFTFGFLIELVCLLFQMRIRCDVGVEVDRSLWIISATLVTDVHHNRCEESHGVRFVASIFAAASCHWIHREIYWLPWQAQVVDGH